ncbi:hypothetical protein AYI70_g2608 [Smittium culicis]|uniref:Transcription factor domain-containing protein n=1 Tax=Smittium culicis TaxID=133412 RepID=A0A1R1Y7N9_9FUNG|nr:hypothetical protein AYI70_g2608 [Smittium culicis]
MTPIRLPEFLYKLKYNLFPEYFLYALLAAGIEAIHPISPDEEDRIDTKYASIATDIIKKTKDTSNPLIVWSTVLMAVYHWKTVDNNNFMYLANLSRLVVKKTKLYKVDVKKKILNLQTEYDLEFKRRIWWTYYLSFLGMCIFRAGFYIVEERDIIVNLPSDDFKWRYGGEVKECDPELISLNIAANNNFNNNSHFDCVCDLIKLFTLHRKISSFLNYRGLNSSTNLYKIYAKFGFYAKKLDNIKLQIDKKYEKVAFYNCMKTFESYSGINLFKKTELLEMTYLIKQMYNCCAVLLYQSELTRHFHSPLDHKRVKAAKIKCLKFSFKISELLSWKFNNIPLKHMCTILVPWEISTAAILMNLCFINDHESQFLTEDFYFSFIDKILQTTANYLTAHNLYSILKISYTIKQSAFKKNCQYTKLRDLMLKYSISNLDVDPWLVPRFSTFFNYNCCLLSNYNTLDIKEFLSTYEGEIPKNQSTTSSKSSPTIKNDYLEGIDDVEKLYIEFSKISRGYKFLESK